MKRSLIVDPLALSDLDAIATHIAVHSLDAALRLYDAWYESREVLRRHPHFGRLWREGISERPPIRVAPPRQFPNYLVFYRLAFDDTVQVMRILHAMRDLPTLFQDAPP